MIPEQELLTKAGQFDTRALTEIYDLYSPRLYRYAMRLLGDDCVAEDCVSETFSRFLKTLQAGKGPRDYLQTYLFRTVHNLVVDHYRRQPATEELDDDLPELETTEGTADSNLLQRRVRDALHQLTEVPVVGEPIATESPVTCPQKSCTPALDGTGLQNGNIGTPQPQNGTGNGSGQQNPDASAEPQQNGIENGSGQQNSGDNGNSPMPEPGGQGGKP